MITDEGVSNVWGDEHGVITWLAGVGVGVSQTVG